MTFKVTIKNIGKLTDAEIRIGRFTVFAGPNNTGKSFVSKLLYSLFDAMNANHTEIQIDNLLIPVKRALVRLDQWLDPEGEGGTLAFSLGSIDDSVIKLEDLVKEVSIDGLDKIIPIFISQTKEMLNVASDIQKSHLKEVENQNRSLILENVRKADANRLG